MYSLLRTLAVALLALAALPAVASVARADDYPERPSFHLPGWGEPSMPIWNPPAPTRPGPQRPSGGSGGHVYAGSAR